VILGAVGVDILKLVMNLSTMHMDMQDEKQF